MESHTDVAVEKSKGGLINSSGNNQQQQQQEWSNLSQKDLQTRSETFELIRKQNEDKVHLTVTQFLQGNMRGVFILFLTFVLARLTKRPRLVIIASICMSLYVGRAKSLNNRLGSLFNLPIFGALPFLLLGRIISFPVFTLQVARYFKFKSFNFSVPGMRAVVLQEEMDRHYCLKENWTNYTKNFGSEAGFDEIFFELLGGGIFAVDGEQWKEHRKIASHMFSLNSLQVQMEQVFYHHATEFVHALKSKREYEVFDLQEWFQSATFDTICEITFGECPDALSEALTGRKPKFLQAFDSAQTILALRGVDPPWFWKMKRVFNIGPEATLKQDIKIINEHIASVLQRRKLDGLYKTRNDLLSLYISFSEKYGLSYINNDNYLRDVLLNIILAGRDTTSCTLTNWMKLVYQHPEVEEKLLKEFREVLGEEGEETIPTWDLMRKCRYADAVFNEVIRLYPPVPIDFRICNQTETLPSGLILSQGDRIGIANIAISRNPKYWNDPDKFNPDRWMTGNTDSIRRPDEFLFPVFWAGPRLCLGKDLARFEVKMFAAVIHQAIRLNILPHKERFVNGPVMFVDGGVKCTTIFKH